MRAKSLAPSCFVRFVRFVRQQRIPPLATAAQPIPPHHLSRRYFGFGGGADRSLDATWIVADYDLAFDVDRWD
jgi:hypothetical protein